MNIQEFFLHQQFQILELKKGFVLKGQKVFAIIANFLHFVQVS